MAMIISGMREGLILIDGDKNVLSCNEGAIHLLQAHITTNYIGHSVMGLCRDPEFMGCLLYTSGIWREKAAAGGATTKAAKSAGKNWWKWWNVPGCVLPA